MLRMLLVLVDDDIGIMRRASLSMPLPMPRRTSCCWRFRGGRGSGHYAAPLEIDFASMTSRIVFVAL